MTHEEIKNFSTIILYLQLALIAISYVTILSTSALKIKQNNIKPAGAIKLFGINFIILLFIGLAIIFLGDFIVVTFTTKKSYLDYLLEAFNPKDNSINDFCDGSRDFCNSFNQQGVIFYMKQIKISDFINDFAPLILTIFCLSYLMFEKLWDLAKLNSKNN